ncbi:aminotransferase class I/II-fold pyridoxal phosphate-dependent enzyme [Alkalicoccobacillus porphyridii]|uniref:Aminotransferase class I/II-fold pyridoxal phosphate-dependent enzyme n=1 Tax=Alkalicoccobacillus porphyridii TaxID=2597270 RepID=A0A553ZUC4_9BACI|nr:aminotransferase class I/II-fold pyridoxal phosphate-dependent enzyme [Alkalicoccobacillus porphyridii]TSB45090.1 aminotransferase class I/II-fold pyridoxal phosphate-dependent enzyme [Alkalicoccobacillus porphyridii]
MTQPHVSFPLVSALHHHIKKNPTSFHVPGHKNGAIIPPGLEAFKCVLPFDLTELEGLDDLHHPTGPIKEAQQLTATFYDAAESFFLVGGSTAGNLAMVYALCQPGDVVFVQRNSHKSILHAVELAGVHAVYLESEIDQETGLAIGISESSLLTALARYPEATALIMTYPNYYGVCLPSNGLIQTAKGAGLKVLVDEAHGAHFVLGEPFPESLLSAGADAVVQSAHKTLPALTMGSYLHLNHQLREDEVQAMKRALSIFQSSSPSYLIMASLDAARGYLETYTKDLLTKTLQSIQNFKAGIDAIEQLDVIEWSRTGYQYDPLKVTIRTACTLNGYQLSEMFHKAGIDVELADEHHVLLVFGLVPFTTGEACLTKLKELVSNVPLKPTPINQKNHRNDKRAPIEYEKHIHTKKTDRVAFWEAEGRIAAEEVTPYPPGIPLVYPGQRIEKDTLLHIKQLNQAGARFQGEDVVEIGICVVEDLEDT